MIACFENLHVPNVLPVCVLTDAEAGYRNTTEVDIEHIWWERLASKLSSAVGNYMAMRKFITRCQREARVTRRGAADKWDT